MAAAKRLGADRSEKRAALLDAAEALLTEEGYGALTSRRVAERAGLKHQLIFYYFHAFDDLLLEVLGRLSDRAFVQLEAAFAAARPVHAVWTVSGDIASSRFVTEFMALANHNPAIRAEIGDFATRFREQVIAGLTRHFAARAIEPALPPAVLAVLMATVSSGLTLETALGLSLGHDHTEAVVRDLLERLDG